MAVGDIETSGTSVRPVDPASLPVDAAVVHVDQLSEAEFERLRLAVEGRTETTRRPPTGDGLVVVWNDYYLVDFD